LVIPIIYIYNKRQIFKKIKPFAINIFYCLKPQPGDFTYSGMHDSGPLVPPKEGGYMAQLLSYVQAAKNLNDQYMTNIIDNNEKNQLQQQQQQQSDSRQQNEIANNIDNKSDDEHLEADNSILPELKKAKMT
jgi:hypothetical protein